MSEREIKLEKAKIVAELIDKNWSSRRSFAESIGMPPTTLNSILTRGIGKASIGNVIKVCKALGITAEQLEEMSLTGVATIAAHHDGEEWTAEELEEIENFKQFIKSKRHQER